MNKLLHPSRIILSALVIAGLPVWFISYHAYTSSMASTVSLVCIFLLSVFFRAWLKNKTGELFLCITGGYLLSVAGKIVIDCIADPTNHNLWPLELVIDGVIISIVAITGILIGNIVKRLFTETHKK